MTLVIDQMAFPLIMNQAGTRSFYMILKFQNRWLQMANTLIL